jgi:hypothetical protein
VGEDYVLRDLEPLFNASGVHLVLMGHAHLWQRFRNSSGVNWLETSHVGRTIGAFHPRSGRFRPVTEQSSPNQLPQGDPGGLEPIVPSIAPLCDAAGPLPYLADNEFGAFSVLDSAAGVVRSYRFEHRFPDQPAILFDEFQLS